MRRTTPSPRQRGAIAVMAVTMLAVVVCMLALVLDLGHLYVAKTGLQNGADAASLAGAKTLDGTRIGLTNAVAAAVGIARRNNYNFTVPVADNSEPYGGLDIKVGACPDDSCMVPTSAIADDTSALNMSFMKVYTRERDIGMWFARIWSVLDVSVSASATAGRYTIRTGALGVCAINAVEAQEFGFLRGVDYNLPDLNPLMPGDPIWINPVDTPGTGVCDSNNGSTTVLAPYVCTGVSAINVKIPGGQVWVNTGTQTAMNGPFNSRFGNPGSYSGGQACDPTLAPPDTNTRQYPCVSSAKPAGGNLAQVGCEKTLPGGYPPSTAVDWMNPAPSGQTIALFSKGPYVGKPFYFPGVRPSSPASKDFSNFGVLWSARHETDLATGIDKTTDDWMKLYGGAVVTDALGKSLYPEPSPYAHQPFDEKTNRYFANPPSGYTTRAGRRIVNLAIINCTGATSLPGQSCKQTLPLLGIGKFFMVKEANLPNEMVGEFMGLASTSPQPMDIRLYR